MSSINLNDYSHDAQYRGWGKGWPSCDGAKNSIVMVTTNASKTKLPVHSKIATLVQFLANETERRGYTLKPAQCWGYNCRQIAGTNRPSNHSWGLAVDLNWNDNPYNTTRVHAMPTWVARLWNEYGFAWGGDYSGNRQDWMHLEFMGTPAQADEMTQSISSSSSVVTTKKGFPSMIERELPAAGTYTGRIACPTGSVSGIVARAWISVTCDGGGDLSVYFNKSADTDSASPGTGDAWTGPFKNGMRVWHEIPNGTEYVWYKVNTKGPGSMLIEMQAK